MPLSQLDRQVNTSMPYVKTNFEEREIERGGRREEGGVGGQETKRGADIRQEAQLMLTNTRDAFRSQSRKVTKQYHSIC